MKQETRPSKEWHYEENGQRKGPVSEVEMKQFIDDGKLSYGSSVWQKGMAEWIKIEDSDLKTYLNDTVPPPLHGELVSNKIVWILAFAPIIGLRTWRISSSGLYVLFSCFSADPFMILLCRKSA